MEVTLIDSPLANVGNIARALRTAGGEVRLARDFEAVRNSRKIVLPGVGSFPAAMAWLEGLALDIAIRDAVSRGAMLLGICVGHQLLFETSDELGPTRGLGLLRGHVRRYPGDLPVPQIGWNRVSAGRHPLFNGISGALTPHAPSQIAQGALAFSRPGRRLQAGKAAAARMPPQRPPRWRRSRAAADASFGVAFYFVNSYAAFDAPDEIARADYGNGFTAAAARERIFGVQFHPEKSSTAGLRLLRNFVEMST